MNLTEYLRKHPIRLSESDRKFLKKLYREKDFHAFNTLILGGARSKGHVIYNSIRDLAWSRLCKLEHSQRAETTFDDFSKNINSAIKSLESDELLTSGGRHYFLERGPAVFEQAENFLNEFRSAHKYCTELMEAFSRENTVCVNIRSTNKYKRDGEWWGSRHYYFDDKTVTDEIIKTLSKEMQKNLCGTKTAVRTR